jgi:hypothetical protein
MNLSDRKIRKAIMAEMGRLGGLKRGQRLPAPRRKEIAQKAANKRWGKKHEFTD